MADLLSVQRDILTLTDADKDTLRSWLMRARNLYSSIADVVTKERFSDGLACPVCGGKHIVRHGKRPDKVQRYMCKVCGHTFVASTNSVVSGTKKSVAVWEKYIECMINGFSLSKSAEYCDIHINTAFAWRHKILDALQNMASDVVLEGIVEADETFFPLSFKGNHRHNRAFTMPRKAHKRGKQINKRGLSNEQVCVPCAVNRNGLSISKATNTGRVTTKNLRSLFDGRIKEGSVFVTDKLNSYTRLANKNGLKLIQLKGRVSKKGIYNIQHINSYHSGLKHFIDKFRGVSTKYLNNYLIWHNFVNYSKHTDEERRDILFRFTLSTVKKVTYRKLSNRPVKPVAV